MSESEVDSRFLNAFLCGNLVQPMVLHIALHQQQRARLQMDGKFVVCFGFVLEIEPAGGAKTHRCNAGVGSELFFVIGVPAHFVAPIAVEIEQYTIEARTIGETFNACFDGEEAGCPRKGLVHNTAVFVDAMWVAVPSGESGCWMGFTKQGNVCLCPWNFFLEGTEQGQLLVGIEQQRMVL